MNVCEKELLNINRRENEENWIVKICEVDNRIVKGKEKSKKGKK